MKYFKEKFSSLWLMWFVIMLVATWSILIQEGRINRDGILYLKQAYLISQGSWKQALSVFNWPFFSILIGFFHKITNIDLQWIAHSVDLTLFSISTYFYLKISQLIYQKKYIIFYAGLVLLSFPLIMDDYVGMILRDPGLWAGCMAGTYFYFKYINHNFAFKFNLLWQSSFLIAGAFRPEGLVFLIAIPLFNIFFFQNNYRGKYFVKFILNQFLLVILGCCFFIFLITLPINSYLLIESVGRLNEFGPRILEFFKQLLLPLPIFTDNEILNKLLQKNTVLITNIFLTSLFFTKIIKGLGILNIILICEHFRKGSKISKQYLNVLYFLITIGLSLVFVSFVNNFVLTDRYFIFSYFWILIVLTPVLYNFFELYSHNQSKLLNFLVIIFIPFYLFNSLIDRNSYSIEFESGKFLKSLELSEYHVDLINADRIAYYAGFSMPKIISSQNYSDNPEWIIYYTKDKINFIKPLNYYIYKRFEYKNQMVLFFKRRV